MIAIAQPSPTAVSSGVEQLLYQQIYRRLGRRVSEVDVRTEAGRVVVRGRASSYHAWQLALAACHEVIDDFAELSLDCAFMVSAQERKA